MKEARKALHNIERLSKSGTPTKSLRAAYASLVKAVQAGTEEQLEKACYVAVQEKSRYVAQRIIRTEMSRAYSDGFAAKVMQDSDVVAVRLKLSTRHPVFDICDLFAEADMYGLGKGVYPKDKMPPIPLHPYCMCRYEAVYAWEVDISKRKDNVKQAGDKWLAGISDENRRLVLGIEGNAMWKDGENWQKYMRNWKGLAEPETRLKDFVFDLQLHAKNDKIRVVDKVKIKDKPNSITQRVNQNGGIDRNFYGADGRQVKQISDHDHGNRKKHPFGKNGEHAHDYTYNENGKLIRGKQRELTGEEVKGNGDIL